MYAGQKMYDNDGNQVCLFPLPELIVNQWSGPNTYSHCCGHPADYDTHGQVRPVYAPFDCHMVYYTGTTAHTVFYCSDTKVRTPSGLQWVTIQLTHAQNPPLQQTAKQGDVIYYSGDAGGYSLGVHLHLDQCFDKDARWVSYGVVCTGAQNSCWALPDSQYPNDVFYVNDTTLTDTGGHTWLTYDGPGPEPPTPPDPPVPPAPVSGGNFKWWMSRLLLYRRNNM